MTPMLRKCTLGGMCPQVAAFVPQAEPGVDEDSDLYSDDGEEDMEVDMPPPVSAPAAAQQQLLARDSMPAAAEANGLGPSPMAAEAQQAQGAPEEQQAAPQQQQPEQPAQQEQGGQQAQEEQVEQQQEQPTQVAEAGDPHERPAARGPKRQRGKMRRV